LDIPRIPALENDLATAVLLDDPSSWCGIPARLRFLIQMKDISKPPRNIANEYPGSAAPY
jgi:hypothetical protein